MTIQNEIAEMEKEVRSMVTLESLESEAEMMEEDMIHLAMQAKGDQERYGWVSALSALRSLRYVMPWCRCGSPGTFEQIGMDGYARSVYGRSLDSIINREGDKK